MAYERVVLVNTQISELPALDHHDIASPGKNLLAISWSVKMPFLFSVSDRGESCPAMPRRSRGAVR